MNHSVTLRPLALRLIIRFLLSPRPHLATIWDNCDNCDEASGIGMDREGYRERERKGDSEIEDR